MRVVVTGARGLLGAAIAAEFAGSGHDLLPLDRSRLDVTDETAVRSILSDATPELIVNCAAYNDVDGAQDDPALALRTNAFAVLALSPWVTVVGYETVGHRHNARVLAAIEG